MDSKSHKSLNMNKISTTYKSPLMKMYLGKITMFPITGWMTTRVRILFTVAISSGSFRDFTGYSDPIDSRIAQLLLVANLHAFLNTCHSSLVIFSGISVPVHITAYDSWTIGNWFILCNNNKVFS